MKKITLAVLFYAGLMDAQVVNVPDANFKNKLLASATTNEIAKNDLGTPIRIDANNDGEIQLSELSQVAELELGSSNISSLAGIKSFTNLQQLHCGNNNISTLDVAGMSNLIVIDCDANRLTTLNVSGLANLYALNVFRNQLTSIDLFGLENLSFLDCSENRLTHLNLSGLTDLEILDCSENQITTFNFAGVNNLSWLDCYDNHFTVLDVSLVPSLLKLYCGDSVLQSVNLSGLTNLTDLSLHHSQVAFINLGDLVNLKNVVFAATPLTAIDLSNSSRLESIWIHDNTQLTSINLKNQHAEDESGLRIRDNTLLDFVCADNSEIEMLENYFDDFGYDVNVNATCALSTVNFSLNNVQAYPNPVKNFTTVIAKNTINNLQLYDIQGRLLESLSVNDTQVLIDMSSRTNGIYLIKISSENDSKIIKVIKE